jgi:hypothetical protein
MAIRKKSTAKSETSGAEENVKTSQKSARVRTTAAAETAGTSNTKAKSPAAATHKAPARKAVQSAPAAKVAAESTFVEVATFDVAFHHEEISKEAYYTWVRNGCPKNTEHSDWLAAIEVVRARHAE